MEWLSRQPTHSHFGWPVGVNRCHAIGERALGVRETNYTPAYYGVRRTRLCLRAWGHAKRLEDRLQRALFNYVSFSHVDSRISQKSILVFVGFLG